MWFPLKAYPPKHKELQLGTILKGPEYLLMPLPGDQFYKWAFEVHSPNP